VPLLTVASSGALALLYQLPSAIVAATTRQAVVSAFDDPVQNLLLSISGPRLQARARALLRGAVMPTAVASAGLLLLAIRGQEEVIPLGPLTLVVAGAYLVVSWMLRREYVRALVTRIREGRLDLTDLPAGVRLGQAEVRTLGQALAHADPQTRTFIVEALGRLGGHEALDTLRGQLADSTPAVRVAALTAVTAIGDARALPWVMPLLADATPSVRAAAIRATSILGGATATQPIRPLLEDPASEVRVAAARALAEIGPLPERTQAVGVLQTLVREGPLAARAHATHALSALGVPLPEGTRAALLAADAVEARRAAVEAAPVPEAELSLLVRGLADPSERVRRAASDHLTAIGGATCLPLVAHFPVLPERGAALALACLARIGSPALREEVDYRVARDVEHAARAAPLRRALARAETPAAYELLRIALDQADRRAIQYAVGLAAGRLSEHVAGELASDLTGANTHRRADALELLLNLVPSHCSAALRQLADATTSPAPAAIDGAVLEEFLDHPDSWVRASALYAIVGLDSSERGAGSCPPALAAVAAETLERLVAPASPLQPPAVDPSAPAGGPDSPASAVKAVAASPPHAQPIEGAYAVLDQLLSLRQVPLFRELTLEQLQALRPWLQLREYLAGEQIVQEGDEGHELFVVLSGHVRIARGERHQAVVLAELGPHDYFGEMALLAERPRGASAVAATDCQVGVLAKEHFLTVLAEHPEVSLAVIRVLSDRLATANDRLANGNDVSQRPATWPAPDAASPVRATDVAEPSPK
jgi:CRP-like cAMP-binding protein/HEAT repeat protein